MKTLVLLLAFGALALVPETNLEARDVLPTRTTLEYTPEGPTGARKDVHPEFCPLNCSCVPGSGWCNHNPCGTCPGTGPGGGGGTY